MLAGERHLEILKRIQDRGGIRVASLAKELNVTEETIRRDLERLDTEGKLRRIRGGALPLESDRRELPMSVREAVNLDRKRAIAAAATRHVNEGDVIALDASSTAREMARLLPDRPVTVISNSLAIATVLVNRSEIRVVSTGGILDAPSLSFVGSVAEESLDRFHIKKLFFSCAGIDAVRGLSVTADEHAGIKKRMMDSADKVYLLADSSKFNTSAVEFFAKLADVDTVITDALLDPKLVEELRAQGVTVEMASM
jgi:DeoR/GlpR family transcriptional regulator of sugar metabolism